MNQTKATLVTLSLGLALIGCGSDGVNGANGFQGAQGNPGPQGIQGPPGTPADLNALVFGQASDNVVITGNVDWSVAAQFSTSTGHQPLDFSFGNLTLSPQATLVVPTGVTIRCQGQLTVGAGALLAVKPPTSGIFPAEGGTISMAGTEATVAVIPLGSPPTVGLTDPYPSLLLPVVAGGSGASILTPGGTLPGGRGGGTLAVRARRGIDNQGSLNVIGQAAFTGGGTTSGGGGGGLAILMWGSGSTFNNTGTVIADGGAAGIPGQNQPGAGGGGGGFIRLAGPGASTVAGTLSVVGGAGTPQNGVVPAGTKTSAGGSSQGNGGGVSNLGAGSNGGNGRVVRTDVADPVTLVSLTKALEP